jgi:hemoglobin/transferrin/lactoferrin receptor protein
MNSSALYKPSDAVWLTASAGSSYRAPALEERYKFIDLGHVVELGNPDLKSERGNFFDLGVKLKSARLEATANAFVHMLDNLITMAPADSVVFVSTDDGTDPIKRFARRYKNISRARLTGFDAMARWIALPGSILYGNISYVYGADRVTDQPLPAIAPLNAVLGIEQRLGKHGRIDIRTRAYDRQNRVAVGEKQTPGYVLLDAYVHSASIQAGKAQLQWTAGIDNVLNTAYRNHLTTNRDSWLLDPGRNFKCRLTILW